MASTCLGAGAAGGAGAPGGLVHGNSSTPLGAGASTPLGAGAWQLFYLLFLIKLLQYGNFPKDWSKPLMKWEDQEDRYYQDRCTRYACGPAKAYRSYVLST